MVENGNLLTPKRQREHDWFPTKSTVGYDNQAELAPSCTIKNYHPHPQPLQFPSRYLAIYLPLTYLYVIFKYYQTGEDSGVLMFPIKDPQ